ncbi:MAG TPA: cysteine protease [Brevundimonas sp.]|uniref:cysteine protease n=1 Tax=Brevundimonas sp. TaxID=1871086 RepID=UPI002DF4F80E|nr:cysteine protease [Brevundimonas sp.]
MTRIATLLGGLLLSRGGRRVAGRHAGKLALATLAFELWQQRRRGVAPAKARPAGRSRWSGRRP